MIINDSILPSVAAALTVESVDTGIKSVVKNLAASDEDMEYIYLRTYPPNAKGAVDSEVGSEPEYAVPPLLSKTLYTLLSDVRK